jgi:hypothetical protein
MPSQILHILFAGDVIEGIYRIMLPRFGIVAEKAREKIALTYRTSFSLGCQGPDIFYHNRRKKPAGLEYGALLHRRGYGVFTAGLLKLGLPDPPPDEEDIRLGRREKGIGALGAYCLGFMTHALLDRAAHPYIVYKSGWYDPARPETVKYRGAHAFLERILDVLMLRRLRGMEVREWDQETLLGEVCEKPPLGLKELLARALVLAYPERAGGDGKLGRRIDNAFADCAWFYRLTAPARTAVKAPGEAEAPGVPENLPLLYPERLEEDIDFLNLEKKPWRYPHEDREGEDRRSFPEIYGDAVNRAVETLAPVIEDYMSLGRFPIKEAAQAIGNGGLSIQDRDGRVAAPTRCDPLPLDRVLEGQRRLRGLSHL